jgi:hypothetical protein
LTNSPCHGNADAKLLRKSNKCRHPHPKATKAELPITTADPVIARLEALQANQAVLMDAQSRLEAKPDALLSILDQDHGLEHKYLLERPSDAKVLPLIMFASIFQNWLSMTPMSFVVLKTIISHLRGSFHPQVRVPLLFFQSP